MTGGSGNSGDGGDSAGDEADSTDEEAGSASETAGSADDEADSTGEAAGETAEKARDSAGFDPSCGVAPAGEPVEGWPARLTGVTETVTATLGPNDRWNQAALGLHAADSSASDSAPGSAPATARSWGRTRTRRNFEARGEGYVQFTRDPVDFVAAALDVHETAAPILESADGWVRVEVEEIDRQRRAGTEMVEWRLRPVEAAVRDRRVPTTSRGYAAVVEATVAASRLGTEAYDDADLVERLGWLETVVEVAGSECERVAFDRIDDLVGWRERE